MIIESQTTLKMKASFDGETLKTHNCDLGEWYSDEICKHIDITEAIESVGLPRGDYEITVTFKRV